MTWVNSAALAVAGQLVFRTGADRDRRASSL
jgi:hypothetical protein